MHVWNFFSSESYSFRMAATDTSSYSEEASSIYAWVDSNNNNFAITVHHILFDSSDCDPNYSHYQVSNKSNHDNT